MFLPSKTSSFPAAAGMLVLIPQCFFAENSSFFVGDVLPRAHASLPGSFPAVWRRVTMATGASHEVILNT